MTKLDITKPLSDDLIDQIVDGVLAPSQLRDAIDCLDRDPDGWKRCALAFLEAQCWRESLRLVGDPKSTSFTAEVYVVHTKQRPSEPNRSALAGQGFCGLGRGRLVRAWLAGPSSSIPAATGRNYRGAVGRVGNQAASLFASRNPRDDGS